MIRGLTVIELLVFMAIIAIIGLALVIAPVASDDVVCRGGYQFVVTDHAEREVQQLLDREDKGIPCAKE